MHLLHTNKAEIYAVLSPAVQIEGKCPFLKSPVHVAAKGNTAACTSSSMTFPCFTSKQLTSFQAPTN